MDQVMTNTDRTPKVSVVMPIHNAARFLEEAVRSILCQIHTDFELLIIDDASTDDSPDILERILDHRIKVYRNERKVGVSSSLNKGIYIARGEYIARMDGDDISLPLRIEKQVEFLDAHPEFSVVGVKCCLIDSTGNDIGLWKSDFETVSPMEIRAMLPVTNCIAHPGIMIRRNVATLFQYRVEHCHSQDYDLWLRLTAAGHWIGKLDEVLLKYRIHQSSVTARSNRQAGGFKNIRTKAQFLIDHIRNRRTFNAFIWRVARHTALALLAHWRTRMSEITHSLARKMLRQIGRCVGTAFRFKSKSGLYFFFPYYHVGGAERVHADIASAVADLQPWIFFTARSKNAAFTPLFKGRGKLINLFPFLGNVFSKHFCTGIIISIINRHSGVTVFGVNSLFFYEILPFLSSSVRCIDMLHAFGSGLEDVSLLHVEKLDRRVVISQKTAQDLFNQYLQHDIPATIHQRVLMIMNKVEIPKMIRDKGQGGNLHIIFVGRDAREKRTHLAANVARLCHEGNVAADFLFVGDYSRRVQEDLEGISSFTGEISTSDRLSEIYHNADILLLTSSSEGFPMVVMEAMAHGVVPLCTDVGGIPFHVTHGTNGFLVPGDADEAIITAHFIEFIRMLSEDRDMLREVSVTARQYAATHFSGSSFDQSYRQLFKLSGVPEAEKHL